MSEVAAEGRTVLFVSHQLGLVRNLCDRAVLFEDGEITLQGSAGEVVDQYLRTSLGQHRGVNGPSSKMKTRHSR